MSASTPRGYQRYWCHLSYIILFKPSLTSCFASLYLEQIQRTCNETRSVSATPACSYDRSWIKRSDIFSRNIRSREIEAESDEPARIFLLLFSLFWKLRIRRTYPAFYQRSWWHSLSSLSSPLSYIATNRVSLRFPSPTFISPLF